MRRVFVVGVGMTNFEKPGKREEFDFPDMARYFFISYNVKVAVQKMTSFCVKQRESVTSALADCGLKCEDIEQAAVGYVYGDSTCGQRALYPLGIGGIPIYNVNNNCATGASALYLAYQFIAGGLSNCALALGFEKMMTGSLTSQVK